jgi:hypothetical protein
MKKLIVEIAQMTAQRDLATGIWPTAIVTGWSAVLGKSLPFPTPE